MHFDKIEDYDFDHGLSFNTQTGEYHSLNPHDLARPLSHVEMDYNLMYQKQTLNGWRIAGSNANLTLNATDLGKVLAFHKVEVNSFDDPGNVMYDRHIAAGLFDGQLIWIPSQFGAFATTTIDPCAGFEVAGVSWTNSLAYQEAAATYNVIPNNATTAEGNMVTFAINTTGVINGTTVNWTVHAPGQGPTQATTIPSVSSGSGSGGGVGTPAQAQSQYPNNDFLYNNDEFTSMDVVGGITTGAVTIQDDLGTVTMQILLDTVAEQSELMVFTLSPTDSDGNATGGATASVNIINIYNQPTQNRPCNDDITYSIEECNDDIVATIEECDDDIDIILDFTAATTLATAATTLATAATAATTELPPEVPSQTINDEGSHTAPTNFGPINAEG